jgi:ankyrin repeat protein
MESDRKGFSKFDLFDAIESWDYELVNFLLDSGASPNGPCLHRNNCRPLEFAIDELDFNSSLSIVELLIRAGANVNQWDFYKSLKPIHHAVYSLNYPCIELLLVEGADPNVPSDEGGLVLTHAVDCRNFAIVKLLLAYGADKTINCFQPLPPFNPLVAAVHNLDLEMINTLIEGGACAEIKNSDGFGVLSYLPERSSNNSSLIDKVESAVKSFF